MTGGEGNLGGARGAVDAEGQVNANAGRASLAFAGQEACVTKTEGVGAVGVDQFGGANAPFAVAVRM